MTWSELRFSCVVKMCLRSSQRETRTITFYDIKARVRDERCKSDPWSSSLTGCEVESNPVTAASKAENYPKNGGKVEVKFKGVLGSSESTVRSTKLPYKSYFSFL